MVEIKEPFSVRLSKALDLRDMKPADLARKLGISESTISQYRSGYSKPKDKRLVIIANILRVDPAWLMGLDVPMEPGLSPIDPDSLDAQIMSLVNALTPENKQALIAFLQSMRK